MEDNVGMKRFTMHLDSQRICEGHIAARLKWTAISKNIRVVVYPQFFGSRLSISSVYVFHQSLQVFRLCHDVPSFHRIVPVSAFKFNEVDSNTTLFRTVLDGVRPLQVMIYSVHTSQMHPHVAFPKPLVITLGALVTKLFCMIGVDVIIQLRLTAEDSVTIGTNASTYVVVSLTAGRAVGVEVVTIVVVTVVVFVVIVVAVVVVVFVVVVVVVVVIV